MATVHFVFRGANLWKGDNPDAFPYSVEIPRVPIRGERIRLESEPSIWTVDLVEFDYSRGLAYDPVVRVTCWTP